ncbi:MAG: phosphoribosylglycinamide formyltransferase, partial [Kiritimatiellae bacterium]|nr:phosphoribosylglycinamide formyltransferase [Kiritimatiellia bacterium]MDW8458380.1 formyltransferase family protein [Verrucomicrobiota bacterium]
YGVRVTGCTVHFVDEGMDTGPIILQKTVPVYDDDTPERLHARIQELEREAYPEALSWLADDRLRIEGRRVFVRPADVQSESPNS